MLGIILIVIGKTVSTISRLLNLGSGSTWPGHIALTLNKNFIKDILKQNPRLKIVIIAGTNGKTTTAKLFQHILEKNGLRVFRNDSGANLLNGIASCMLLRSSILCTINYDYAIFEVDENTLPLALYEIRPDYIILLNLFRDQLDRYGEVDSIVQKWKKALIELPKTTTLLLNADDPELAFLGTKVNAKVLYFGIEDEKHHVDIPQVAADSTFCPSCGTRLTYSTTYFSHLGKWQCPNCKLKRPKVAIAYIPLSSLYGLYNKYNLVATMLLAETIGVAQDTIASALSDFTPAFGRQEVIEANGKKAQIFLSKNPTGFNESLRTVRELGGKYLLLVLNDRIPDGKDVSWIWDIDFEHLLSKEQHVYVSGDRAYDLSVRLKYARKTQISKLKSQINNLNFKIHGNLEKAIQTAVAETPENKILYILPTYTAMLEVRKLLTGKKIH